MTTQQGEMGGDVDTVELRGKVKWFNAVKGYGFLALDSDNSDAFLHVTTLRQSGHEDLKPGATVVCAGVRGPKGWQVMKVLDVDSSTAVAKDTVFVASKSRDEQIAALKDQLAQSKAELAKVSAEPTTMRRRSISWPSKVTSKGLGSTKPISPNTTAEGRQENRRVELVKV